jgi:SNF2 family DNA or RNA helicase
MSDKIKPYEYQESGITKTLQMKRVINGDEMGLGKSLEAIVSVERAHATPCLVICPAALKINWERRQSNGNGSLSWVPSRAHRQAFRGGTPACVLSA